MAHQSTPVATFCENHDQAGSCTQECADLTNAMTDSFDPDYSYDPTGCRNPAPKPETVYLFDAERRRVTERTVHPYQCSCGGHGDAEPIPCPECGGAGVRFCPICGGEAEIMSVEVR